MKHAAIFVVILTLLLAGTSLAQASGPGTHMPCAVDAGTVSGGGYRLSILAWQVSGWASGGGYRLQGQSAPAEWEGNGCCCTYLPCVPHRVR